MIRNALSSFSRRPDRGLAILNHEPIINYRVPQHYFHLSTSYKAVKPYLLADIGEGITECQIMRWFVQPGDIVQQFDPICEVQSDKASVEITSRYEGIIKAIHYSVDDMAAVGSALLDIDTTNEKDINSIEKESTPAVENGFNTLTPSKDKGEDPAVAGTKSQVLQGPEPEKIPSHKKNSGLAMPAVRHMLKEHNLNIADIEATGKGGRVLKEDVQNHLASRPDVLPHSSGQTESNLRSPGQDVTVTLTPVQNQMFQSMTASLSIPHFLYTQVIDLTDLTTLRKRCMDNPKLKSQLLCQASGPTTFKLSPLPFVIKALSEVAKKYPILNSSIQIGVGAQPQLTLKGAHNVGIAMDTPKGLVVPVIRDVQKHSIMSLAAKIEHLSWLGRQGKLSPNDLKGATMIVSNIGSIGGHAVAPIIMSPMVMILGVGRSQNVPDFRRDNNGNERLEKREKAILSWSADHRVLDGATVARCAEGVSGWLENIDALGLVLI